MKILEKYTQNELYQTILDMVAIPSITTHAEEERRIARYIYDKLGEEPYFKDHQEDLRMVPIEDDPLERVFSFAIVRAKKPTSKTIILTGHMDVVDTTPCGTLAPWAFNPVEYTERLAAVSIPENARQDLETGEWLFGRGIADMKGGLAAGLQLTREVAHTRRSDVNIIYLAVPDEENNSAGMRAASKFLEEYARENDLSYLACIDLEPTFATNGMSTPSIYLGTIGKVNTFFYSRGKESHVGEYFEGFSATPIMSYVNLALEGNPFYADKLKGQLYPPTVAMRQTDLRQEYSATTVSKGFAFYSHLTATKMPSEILSEVMGVASRAANEAVLHYDNNLSIFHQKGGITPLNSWKPTVLSYEKLETLTSERLSEHAFEAFMEDALAAAGPDADERERASSVIDNMVRLCMLEPPVIVTGFLPPWYPHRTNEGVSDGEIIVADAANCVVEKAQAEYGLTLDVRPLFEGISDLSYCGFQGPREELEVFARNMPGWGRIYSLPLDALKKLNIPVISFGPHGRDAHSNTERIHLPYALDVFPNLLRLLVNTIVEKHIDLKQ